MDKQEPKIIAGNLSDDELHSWMRRKIEAARELKSQHETKHELLSHLERTEACIAELIPLATIEVLQHQELTGEESVACEEYFSHPDLLQVSSSVLLVVKDELDRQRVQPSVENIRCVLSLIDGSLPVFTI